MRARHAHERAGAAPAEAPRLTALPNGLRIVTETMPRLATAALGVWIGAGSRHELEQEHGLAHLLEHMAFKGTARRSARAIAEEIENVGGDLNAETGAERTAYFARVLGADVPLALDILADILIHPAFRQGELRREKGVILQEIGACEDAPDELVFDIAMETAYAGAPIGRRILGSRQKVRTQTPASMRAFLERHYRAPRIVVAACGAVSHDQVVEEVERRFDGLALGESDPPPAGRYTGGEKRVSRQLEQAHLVLAFEGLSFHDPGHYALHVFSSIVGGGMSSRLFQEVREKRGLCYDIHSDYWPFSDTGLFSIYGGTGEKTLASFLPVLLDCLSEAALRPSEAEVARARAQMKVGLLTALESPARRAEQLARHVLAYGRVLPCEEIVTTIDAISASDVAQAGRAALARAPTLAAVGPVRKLPGIEAIRRHLGTPAPPVGQG